MRFISKLKIKDAINEGKIKFLANHNKNDFIIKRLKSGPATDCFHCEFKSSGMSDLFMKNKSETESDSLTTFNEYQTLKNLWPKYKNEKVNLIPTPYSYEKDFNLLLTSFVDGTSFSKSLSLGLRHLLFNFNSKKLVRKVEQIVDWLVDYENKIYADKFAPATKFINYYCDEKINQISFIDESEKRVLKEKILNYLGKFEEFPVHFVNTDFNPTNIIMDHRKITVVDWEKIHSEGLIFWMASSFERYIYTLSTFYTISNRACKSVVTSFRDNYLKKTKFANYSSIYNLVKAFNYITTIAESPNSINGNPPNRRESTMIKDLKSFL